MTDDEQAIRDLVDNWMTASRAGDSATLLSLLADDVIFMVPGMQPFGKEAFARSPSPDDPKIDGDAEIIELKNLGDGWALLRNRLRITITPQSGQPILKTGYTLTILRKTPRGQWQISRDANLVVTEPACPD
ncbi:MAG: SgcJ/EcaC family oxidoreductase [Anaerolineae bacterium]|nr:SgcJ/EcaC family oxidoreductase [Phycisphaerae bacterium]